jgi:NAD(P)-dependent dehydrogenase (short-subunit alcohol dehydrogenase family)
MDIRLDGRTALVTGASSGLGLRFAMLLAEAGAQVAVCARRKDRLDTLVQAITAKGGRAAAIAMDVTDVPSVRAGFAAAEAALGPIDIVVNNSGVAVTRRAAEVEEADYDEVMDTNLRGAFFVAQAAGRAMMAAKRPGRIINIASAAGLRPLAQIAVYSMSKAAVIHMTKSLALEWGRHGINVNAVCPGYIETEINRDYWKTDGGQKLMNMLPRKRVGQPEDLDGLVLLLASDASGFINGAVIAADDGLTAA